MKSGFGSSRSRSAIIAVLGLCCLVSCRSLIVTRSPSPMNAAGTIKSILADPFSSVDPIMFTNANSVQVLANDRVVPATAVAGKRHFTLEDCRAIALAKNLELQAARVDQLTKRAIEYSNKTKLLPHFLFTGELSDRDNPLYSFSDVLGLEGQNPNPGTSGTGVTNYSTSHERSTWRYVLETRWSPIDAALAYYVSKSSINDTLKAHFQKVRVAQKLISVVDAAYFRLLALQECQAAANGLVNTRSEIAAKMKRLIQNRMVGVEEFNRAQRNAVTAQRLRSRIMAETEKQRNILASAMGLSPDYCVDGGFIVVGLLKTPTFNVPSCDLELIAVQNRPEAFEAGLNHLNSTNDLKRTVVKYLPKVTGFWRYTRDKDRFLYNKDWKDVGLYIYFDLLDWLANVSESSAAQYNTDKTGREMGAVALGIASQVRVAALQYQDAAGELKATEGAIEGTNEVLRVATVRASRDDLDRIALDEAKANLVQDRLERSRALGEANATLAELQGAMGTNFNEPRPPN